MIIKFEFDLEKSAVNREKHGIDFVQAQAIWGDADYIEIPLKADDELRFMVIGMIEQIRKETKTSLLFVSHQQEKGFEPDKTFELTASATGSTGAIV